MIRSFSFYFVLMAFQLLFFVQQVYPSVPQSTIVKRDEVRSCFNAFDKPSSLVLFSCPDPSADVDFVEIKKDQATVRWDDLLGSNWEYFVKLSDGTAPVGSGGMVSSPTVTVTSTSGTGSTALLPNTEYEFYIKRNCGADGSSAWVGPMKFKTLCAEFTVPFTEGFNSTSTSLNCWTIIDQNKDSTSPTGSGIWKTNKSTSSYEGDQAMYFTGSKVVQHDDWLISPAILLDVTKTYELTYFYKTNTNNRNSFELLLSTKGPEPLNFTTTLQTKVDVNQANWVKETVILGNISGPIHLAWRVNSKNSATAVYVDLVNIDQVDCPSPYNLEVKDQKPDQVTVLWVDDFGSDWEYVIQERNANTTLTTGTPTTSKQNVIDSDYKGDKLQANTAYEYYVRTKCGASDFSSWFGPFYFRTTCAVTDLPFWEGFNTDSTTLPCWSVVDVNDDATSPSGSNIWRVDTTRLEGTHSMYFYGLSGLTHDDWLISPSFDLDSSKYYRLKYNYRTNASTSYTYEFEVKWSNKGIAPDDFTQTIIPKQNYPSTTLWVQEYQFLKGLSGTVNIGIHLQTSGATYLYIDGFSLEEVQGCPEPMELDIEDIKPDQVTISWSDDFNASQWEYFVQRENMGTPSTNGIVTNIKRNTVDKLTDGTAFEANTDYEYYVRTICGGGQFSIWQGPFRFATACLSYPVPFWEGFNTDSNTARCWTILDLGNLAPSPRTETSNNIWRLYNNNIPSGVYEGNRSMYFNGTSATEANDDWLISPAFDLQAGDYVLKYHYRASSSFDNELEVLLSTSGMDTASFKTALVPLTVNRNGDFVEKVVFFSAAAGQVHIAWHAPSKANVYYYLDNVFLNKVEHCPEPVQVSISDQTSTGFDVHWQESGSATSWEVLIVDYGQDHQGVAVQQLTATTESIRVTGLASGAAYRVYVRAICDDLLNTSNWATPVYAATMVGANNECSGAITIPVNRNFQCDAMASGSFLGSTESGVDEPNCQTHSVKKKDVWFEFTATSQYHVLSLKNLISFSAANPPTIYVSIYDYACGSLSGTAFSCFQFTSTVREKIFMDLTPGQTYYVRLAISHPNPDFVFNLCISSSDYDVLEVSPSGQDYTVEELVKDVLISSQCDMVSNVKFQAGDGSTNINSLGYFKGDNVDFPFKEGIVLATGDVKHIPGPHTYTGLGDPRGKIPMWDGDPDLNKVIDDLGGAGFGTKKAVSVLEFDFVPVKDSIKFEYVFASQSYHKDCISFGCKEGGALFAAWLIDQETGEGQNLALIPGTDLPIALSTIRDTKKSGLGCESRNEEFYWRHYANNVDNPLDAAVNFVGLTTAMSSETVAVKSCKKYKIKLAIADFCDSPSHTSAVFFNANSFDLGTLDLGNDMLIETDNAICEGEQVVIESGISGACSEDSIIQWYKDGVLLTGEQDPQLVVSESGSYSVKIKFTALNCESEGSIRVEVYPKLSTVIQKPSSIEVCQRSLFDVKVDLTSVEQHMFTKVDRSQYEVSYYSSKSDAELSMLSIDQVDSYNLGTRTVSQVVYIKVIDLKTGCDEIFELTIVANQGDDPAELQDVEVCSSYVLPELGANQYYFTESAGQGQEFLPGDVLTQIGTQELFVLQRNGDQGCYEETSFKISITQAVQADVFEDVVETCNYYKLKPLSEHNKYFTEPDGGGQELQVGSYVGSAAVIYVYASSEDGLCVDQSKFKVDYQECPIQKGVSPNGDGLNDFFDLSSHSVSSLKIYNRYGVEVYTHGPDYVNQWYGQNNQGKLLPDGTYYYVVITHGQSRTGWVQVHK